MTTPTITTLIELQQQLRKMLDGSIEKKVFVGFDGFVDTIKKAVKQKKNLKPEYYNTLHDFSERIKSASGKSGQIEMVTQKIKLGGNAPILSNTLGKLGISSCCVGSLGYPQRHPVFSAMNKNCDVISVLDPG